MRDLGRISFVLFLALTAGCTIPNGPSKTSYYWGNTTGTSGGSTSQTGGSGGTTTGGTTTTSSVQEGVTLYNANCAACHGLISSTWLIGVSASLIQTAIDDNYGGMGQFQSLTPQEIQDIADALSPSAAALTDSPQQGTQDQDQDMDGDAGDTNDPEELNEDPQEDPTQENAEPDGGTFDDGGAVNEGGPVDNGQE